jgi:hypothetical protein
MSLFNFFHSYIQENPDLLKINNFSNPIYYEQFYTENRKNVIYKENIIDGRKCFFKKNKIIRIFVLFLYLILF